MAFAEEVDITDKKSRESTENTDSKEERRTSRDLCLCARDL